VRDLADSEMQGSNGIAATLGTTCLATHNGDEIHPTWRKFGVNCAVVVFLKP
jgi:hypothetical protein